jgi:hypothetical protein
MPTADHNPEKRAGGPIFIVGSGSSGSHLLASFLDAHTQISFGPELWAFNRREFFQPFANVRQKMAGWLESGLMTDWPLSVTAFFRDPGHYGHTTASILDLVRQSKTHREFIDGFFRETLEKRQKSIWGEKTLSNYRCLDHLVRIYPDARIIHMARHGLDTMVSFMKRGNSAHEAASHWMFENAGVLAWKDDPRYLLVRYEDLVRDTQSEIQRVCNHLGVSFEPSMLDGSNHDSRSYWSKRADGNYHSTWTNRPDGAVSSAAVGRYVQELSQDAESLFWAVELTWYARHVVRTELRRTSEVMAALGYPSTPQRSLPGVAFETRAKLARSYLSRAMNELRVYRRLYLPRTLLLW